AVDRLDARRVDVLPCEVVPGARGQDLDVVVGREGLRDPAAFVLGAAVDLRAIALHHEGESEPGVRAGHPRTSARARGSRCPRRVAPIVSASKARSRARWPATTAARSAGSWATRWTSSAIAGKSFSWSRRPASPIVPGTPAAA